MLLNLAHLLTMGAFIDDGDVKLTSAEIETAYEGVRLDRSVAIIEDAAFDGPVIIDLVEAHSEIPHSYDLPFHYNGHLIETNFEVKADPTSRTPLGNKNGYQYLWKLAEASPVNGLSQVTWLLDRKFYSVSSSVPMTVFLLSRSLSLMEIIIQHSNTPSVVTVR